MSVRVRAPVRFWVRVRARETKRVIKPMSRDFFLQFDLLNLTTKKFSLCFLTASD